MNYEVETADIEFLPHCSNCGFELDIKEVDYSDLSYNDERYNERAKFLKDHKIEPYFCPQCGAHLESILIYWGWYNSQVNNQYKDMIDFIKYLDYTYSHCFENETIQEFSRFRKFYTKE